MGSKVIALTFTWAGFLIQRVGDCYHRCRAAVQSISPDGCKRFVVGVHGTWLLPHGPFPLVVIRSVSALTVCAHMSGRVMAISTYVSLQKRAFYLRRQIYPYLVEHSRPLLPTPNIYSVSPPPSMSISESISSPISALISDSRALWIPSKPPHIHRPSALQFLRDHVSQSVPCVFPSHISHWPASTLWSNPNYLSNHHGSIPLSVTLTPDGRADALLKPPHPQLFALPHNKNMTLAQLIYQLQNPIPNQVPYYAAQDGCFRKELAPLLDDIDENSIRFAEEAFGEKAEVLNIWIGDQRSVTSMHADPYENLYAVACGKKIFELRPPCDAAILRKPKVAKARWKLVGDQWQLDKIDGHVEWIDESGETKDQVLVVEVNAGDMLYLPALWCKLHCCTII